MTAAAAVLAAGRGSRLGGDGAKPLLEWRGRPLLAWALDAASASGLDPLVVVVGYRADDVRAAIEAALPPPRTTQSSPAHVADNSEMFAGGGAQIAVVENPAWEEGIASSLRAVIDHLLPRSEVDAVCVGLADQPRVTAAAYARVAATAGDLVVPMYGGRPGNPVKLSRSLWSEASELRGDVGARALASRHAVVRVDCTDTGSAADVDTLDDLERLQQEDQ